MYTCISMSKASPPNQLYKKLPENIIKKCLQFCLCNYLHRLPAAPVTDDVLETSSMTSQSSAYCSLTPSTIGSVTELSDTASVDSYNEYDLKKKNGVSCTIPFFLL